MWFGGLGSSSSSLFVGRIQFLTAVGFFALCQLVGYSLLLEPPTFLLIWSPSSLIQRWLSPSQTSTFKVYCDSIGPTQIFQNNLPILK